MSNRELKFNSKAWIRRFVNEYFEFMETTRLEVTADVYGGLLVVLLTGLSIQPSD